MLERAGLVHRTLRHVAYLMWHIRSGRIEYMFYYGGVNSFPPPAAAAPGVAVPAGVRGAVGEALTVLRGLPDGPAGLAGAVAGLSDRDLVAVAGEVEALGRLVDAARVRVADEVDARSVSGSDDRLSARYGCRNAVELLERVTGCSVRSIQARVGLGRGTRARRALTGEVVPARFAHVAAVLDAGLLGCDACRVLTGLLGKAAARVGAAELAAAEAELVGYALGAEAPLSDGAVGGTPDAADDDSGAAGDADAEHGVDGASSRGGSRPTYAQVEACGQVWVAWLDQDGVDPEADRAERRRGLWLGAARDGLVPLRGSLVPEVAAGLQRLLDAHRGSTVQFRPDPADASIAPAGADPAGADPARLAADATDVDGRPVSDRAWSADEAPRDPRTAAQRRHDDLGCIIQAAARAAEAPTIGGAAPTLVVTIDADDLATGGPARVDQAGAPVLVPGALAQRVACSGAIQRVAFDRAGRIVELGTQERLFNAAQRRAIAARDGGCVIPGCSLPAGWCEIHHVRDWADGGPTHTDNGVALCWWHHHHLDESGWRIHMLHGIPHLRAPGLLDPYGTWRPAHHPDNHTKRRERARGRARDRSQNGTRASSS